jgi:ribosomal protein S18 acetylase RimI-like enzyme
MRIGLRPATAADSEFCYRVHRAAMGEYVAQVWGWDEEVQVAFHRRGFEPGRFQVVTVDGADAGLLVVERRPDEIYLGRIELDPPYQGRGVGGRLLGRLLVDAAAAGLPLTLDVLVVNSRARALYQRLGFRELGRHGDNGVKVRMGAGPGLKGSK